MFGNPKSFNLLLFFSLLFFVLLIMFLASLLFPDDQVLETRKYLCDAKIVSADVCERWAREAEFMRMLQECGKKCEGMHGVVLYLCAGIDGEYHYTNTTCFAPQIQP